MTEDVALRPMEKPEGYRPPDYAQVQRLLADLKRQRQPALERMWRNQRARRDQWDDVVRLIPSAYRKMLLEPGDPRFRDAINRVAGLISKNKPMPEVMPGSGRPADVDAAAKEEARLHALIMQIGDQQDRDPYDMGIDAQTSLGESWIGVYPDPRRFGERGYERKKDEDGKTYKERYERLMADAGVPICIDDFDPLTVFPLRTATPNRLAAAVIESEHQLFDVELGFGYHPVKNVEGKVQEWIKTGHTLSEPYVASDSRWGESAGVVDHDHDRNTGTSGAPEGPVKKIMFFDSWTYQCYLDGVLVEQWEHGYGIVPLFPAEGENTSDRDPGYRSHGVADPALTIARQVVFFSAVLASQAAQHGFPTPFLKNPAHGLVHPQTGEPLTRQVALGEMNLMGAGEDIVFPFLDARMMPDFFRYMDHINGLLEQTTLSNFGKAIGTDIAGYAIAQIRAMQMSVLAPIYGNATRQWRKICYFLRFLVRNQFPAGIYMRGAVETEEVEGGREIQYRPVLRYGKDDCTDFAINVHIDEGIQQDEIAERKSALEMKQAGVWSTRRVMEKTGVEDPAAEKSEIDMERLFDSPASDQVVLQMAMQIASERHAATRQDMSSPFYQALEQSKQTFLTGQGQFQNQGAMPVNQEGGVPMGADDSIPIQPGGPTTGPSEGIRLDALGIPKMPGGVKGVQQVTGAGP